MDFKKEFTDLANKYNLNYQYQDFKNCFGGNWWVYTHSLYNDSGCFTIHCLPQRGEVDFYFADKFSTDRKELCSKAINVYEVEKEIWEKKAKIWFFKNPFYYCNQDKIIKTLIEVINVSIEKNNEFFGIDIMNVDSIVKIQQITRVPKSQDYFIGVINLRGEIVPVMSLRKRFGVEEVPDDSATRIIILKLDQNLVGIKVDMVRDVVALEETDIEKNNIVTENNGQMFIKAVGKHDDELISILGLHSVVIDREQA